MSIIINKFFKFLLVGLSGMIIDFTITFICKEKVKLNKYIANSLGFLIAAITNFILNKNWTFDSKSTDVSTEFYWFMGISIISLFIYNSIVWVGINRFKINFYLSKMIGIFVITFWNFFAHLLITFQTS